MNTHPNCELVPNVYSVALDLESSSVAVARLMLRAALWDWRLDRLADTAQLIISELTTNAIKFASRVEVIVFLRGDRGCEALVIEVVDDDERLPEIVDAGADDESYRGLVLVDALASKWGYDLLELGKVVWAELACDE